MRRLIAWGLVAYSSCEGRAKREHMRQNRLALAGQSKACSERMQKLASLRNCADADTPAAFASHGYNAMCAPLMLIWSRAHVGDAEPHVASWTVSRPDALTCGIALGGTQRLHTMWHLALLRKYVGGRCTWAGRST